MKIEQKVLNEALKYVMPAIGDKGRRYILQTILMQCKKDVLTLRTTNEDIEISTQVSVDSNEDFEVCVDPMFQAVIGTFDSGIVDIEVENRLIVTQGRRIHKIAYAPAKQFPASVEIGGYQEVDMPKLLEAFKSTFIAYAREPDRPILECYILQGNTVSTSDGISKFALYEGVKIPGPDMLFPVRGKFLDSVMPILEKLEKAEAIVGGSKVGEDKTIWMSFKDKNTTVTLKKIDKELTTPIRTFFDITENNEACLTLNVKTASLNKALEACVFYYRRALTESKPHHAVFNYKAKTKTFTVKMDIPDLASFEEPIEITESEGGDYQINVNPKAFQEIVTTVGSESFIVKFWEPKDLFLISDPKTPAIRYLGVPLIIRG